MINIYPRIVLGCDGLDADSAPLPDYIGGDCSAMLELSPFTEEAEGWIVGDTEEGTWWPIVDVDDMNGHGVIVDETFSGFTFDTEDVHECLNVAKSGDSVLCPACAARCVDPDVVELLAKLAAARSKAVPA